VFSAIEARCTEIGSQMTGAGGRSSDLIATKRWKHIVWALSAGNSRSWQTLGVPVLLQQAA